MVSFAPRALKCGSGFVVISFGGCGRPIQLVVGTGIRWW